MPDTLPDRLATSPRSKFYDAELLKREIGIRINGKQRTDVEEYCISEGWVRVPVGKARDRHGNLMTVKLSGKVEAYLVDATAPSGDANDGGARPT